ncbi:NAD+ synthase [Desulfacinum hydrothermale DSM 13146]|uniref:NAD+ synthase n=1 Tax=Desulfacinum hydrothermale DSM 13146 TaxID=1121390 RepID=A0A1W1XJ33_9BACT|nr:NAD+ synthase [Desulfacinum hydrothermale DSM 13146]
MDLRSFVEMEEPFEAEFVAFWKRKIRAGVSRGKFHAVVLGASGGLDSAVCAALSVAAGVPVVAVQMVDRRVRGETYNPGYFDELGAERIPVDITEEVADRERRLGLPPHWTTVLGLNLLVRVAPRRMLWALMAQMKRSHADSRLGRHYERLLTAHRVRRCVLQTIAAKRGGALLNCANRTECELGFFVEGGVDDVRFGQWAPLAGLYKFQVRRLARFLALPPRLLQQSPSPGFGGVRDEHFLGPYELVDRILMGLNRGCSDAVILRALKDYAERVGRPLSRRFRPFLRTAYVEHLRQLRHLSAAKRGEGGDGSCTPPIPSH